MEYQSMPILSVRFKMPEPRKNYVSRKALMDQLKVMDKKKVTIVKAGAGSGKTTLLSSYIKENSLNSARWITLDSNMNQVFVFWKYVLEGTKDFLGEAVADFQSWFDCNMQKDNIWQLLTLYMNKIYQEKDIILVLDDFHNITDQFLVSTLDFFVANMPDNLHLVLLTRVIPDIYLGTVSMEDNLLLLDEQEIRMTKEECREFLIHTIHIDVDEDKMIKMVSNSNGWIGGLQLMAVAAKEQSQPVFQSINTAGRVIDDYITKEIFLYLSAEEKDFLRKTSILAYFNRTICEKYLPQYDFEEIMKSILRKNLFVISIDEEAMVYRYHSIMKDYLTGLFNQEEEQKSELHNLASDIYYGLEDYEESLSHLFTIGEYEKIMKRLLKMPQTGLTFSYMMKVPLEEISKSRDFAYQYFFCHYASLEVEACERIYGFISEHFKDDITFPAINHSDLFFNLNWEFKNITIIPLEKIDALPLSPVTKAYILIKEAYFLYIADQSSLALQYLDRTEEIYKETGNDYIKIFIMCEKAQILEDIGELKQGLLIYQEMKPLLKSLPTMKSSYYIGIAGLYLRQLKLQKAEEALISAKESLVNLGDNVNSAYLYTLAEFYYLTGEHEKTEKIIMELAKVDVYQSIFFSARLLRYPIYRGNHKELALKFAKDYEANDEIIKRLDTELLYAGIIYEDFDKDKAFLLADKIISRARKNQNKLKIIEGALLKVRFMMDKVYPDRDVINLFLEAVSYAYEDNTVLPFWFEKETVVNMLNKYSEQLAVKLSKKELEFLQKSTKVEYEKSSEHRNGISYDLTERETEVLNEMKKGCSNRQIAENLCISLATVKSHIINIYSKLEVNNRVAAINKTIVNNTN